MNTLVLAIAGVLVFGGLVLIVVSFLIGRARSATDGSEAESAPTEAAKEQGAFIDEPLATDLATQLAGRKRSDSAPSPASTDASAGPPVATDAGKGATQNLLETDPESRDGAAEALTPALTPAIAPTFVPVMPAEAAGQVALDLLVRLRLEPTANAMDDGGGAEISTALAPPEGRKAKLKLYVEIGDDFHEQQAPGRWPAPQVQVTSYTDNPVLLKHLKQMLTEITEWDDAGAADEASGSKKESD